MGCVNLKPKVNRLNCFEPQHFRDAVEAIYDLNFCKVEKVLLFPCHQRDAVHMVNIALF